MSDNKLVEYRAEVSAIELLRNKYESTSNFLLDSIRYYLAQTPIEQDKLARVAEHYSFCYKMSGKMIEWLMREKEKNQDGIDEIILTEDDVGYLKSVTLLDKLAEATAVFESNISFVRH